MTALGEWRVNWRVAVAAALGCGVGSGLSSYTAGLFIEPLQSEFGWSRSEIAAGSLFGLAAIVVMPLLGRLVDVHGARRMGMAGLSLWGLSFVALASMTGPIWQYYLIHTLMAFVAMATGVVIFARPVAQTFDKARGSALGLAMAGTSIATFVLYPVIHAIIDQFGWRVGYLFLGILPLLIGVPVIGLWLKPRSKIAAAGAATQREDAADGTPFLQAIRRPAFWLLLAAMIAGNIPVGGILNQLQPILHGKGFDPATAAMMGSVFAAAIAIGRIACGMLLDRFSPSFVIPACLAAPIVGALILLTPAPPLWAAIFATAAFGLAQGVEGDFLAFLVARYFGLKAYATIYSVLMTSVAASTAIGAVIYAASYDRFGDYAPAFRLQIALFAASALLLVVAEQAYTRRRRSLAAA